MEISCFSLHSANFYRLTLGWKHRWGCVKWQRAQFTDRIASDTWASSKNTRGKRRRQPVGPGDIACWKTLHCISTTTLMRRRRSVSPAFTASGCIAARPLPVAGNTRSNCNRRTPRRGVTSSLLIQKWIRNGNLNYLYSSINFINFIVFL